MTQRPASVSTAIAATADRPSSFVSRCGPGAALLLALLVALFLSSPISPVPIDMLPLQELPPSFSRKGYEANSSSLLLGAEHVGKGKLVGPESMVTSADGEWLYAGLADGRIVRLDATLSSHVTVARTGAGAATCGVDGERWGGPTDRYELESVCGRPLGLRLVRRGVLVPSGDPDETVLVVADAYKGLLMVSGPLVSRVRPTGRPATVTTLARRAQGDEASSSFSLLNDLAELDGEIYITESFRHFQRRRIAWAALEGRPTGRLLKWSKEAQAVSVVRDQLFFPNGITNMHGGEGGEGLLLVMNLTQAWRYEPATDRLSHWADFYGSGDNIRTHTRTPSGVAARCYWLGWGSKHAKPFSLGYALRHATLLKRLAAAVLPYGLLLALIPKMGMLAALDEQGRLLELHLDRSARTPWLSEAEEFQGKLVLGSWYNDFLAVAEREPQP